jgi:hypothetical protein
MKYYNQDMHEIYRIIPLNSFCGKRRKETTRVFVGAYLCALLGPLSIILYGQLNALSRRYLKHNCKTLVYLFVDVANYISVFEKQAPIIPSALHKYVIFRKLIWWVKSRRF